MGKRGNGAGSIYKRKSDNKCVGSLTLDNGKRKVVYGKTQKEVQDKLKEALYEQQKGTLVATSQQTIEQFLTDWLENTYKRRIRPRTYERYQEAIKLHIVPASGRHQLQKLTPQHVQSFYAREEKNGLAPATIIYYHSVLHNALNMAVKWGLINRNVCDVVSPPRKTRYEIQPLNTEQIQKLLSVLSGHKWEALFTLAIVTGLRRGEILALKWQDINVDTGTLQVRRILSRVPTNTPDRHHVYVEAEPKTQKSRRNVVIAPLAIVTLRKHQALQVEARTLAGKDWLENDYVFCTACGNHLGPNYVVDVLKGLLKQAGLPSIRFHDLRHSAASLLLSLGTHPKVVQELLGHTHISMTLDIYSHVLPGMQQEAMNKLSEALENTKGRRKKKGKEAVATCGGSGGTA